MQEPRYNSGSFLNLRRRIDGMTQRYTNFPVKGITFLDLSSAFGDKEVFPDIVKWAVYAMGFEPGEIDKFGGPEVRGYGLAGAMAAVLGGGHAWQRKPGKLPGELISATYEREYGTETLQMPEGSVRHREYWVSTDDLIAFGGSMGASVELAKRQGAIAMAMVAVAELTHLGGRRYLEEHHPGVPVHTLLHYEEGELIGDTGCHEMVLIEEIDRLVQQGLA